MNIRFYNARILTMQEGQPVFSGELWTAEDRILYVGDTPPAGTPRAQAGDRPACWDREIDCRGNLLMPGFKNAHTHSAMTFLRSHADDMPLDRWLNEQVFPFEAKLTPQDIGTLTKLAILEYLTGGVTGIMEMYLTPETIAAACSGCGMRVVQVGGCNNFSQSPELLEKWYEELNHADPLTSFQLGFHAEYTCSPDLLETIAGLAHRFRAPVFTHCEETLAETQGCMERYGKTPVALLSELGIWDFGGAGYHLVHTNEEDRRILKEKNIGVVTNPASNAKLASGIAPLSEYLTDGIPVAIGTDGPASNNCLDMFREMFLATALAKLRTGDASAVPALEVLRMATVNGAHIMRLPETDVLAAGKLADLILLDLQQPNMQPVWDIPNNIVYSGSKSNVMLTMIGGVIRYELCGGEQRFHIGEEPADIYREVEAIQRRIFMEK
ncbi:amidohydrolase family protein [Lachnoclostridium sp. Marseille-P6806]|uniref:amidohydrolase family protein n=1 Tax=Lachnoclostridium sp. Marseille-P6806 TaxID=2364793 RepID=UPI00103235B5|nr:amidohydrolase [Lachnoclostridium sp. Marseille-P6806]